VTIGLPAALLLGNPAAVSSVATCNQPGFPTMTGGGAILIPPNANLADITETTPLPQVQGFAPTSWRATAAWDGTPPLVGGVPQIQAFAICAP
jgi:hypothetical protein